MFHARAPRPQVPVLPPINNRPFHNFQGNITRATSIRTGRVYLSLFRPQLLQHWKYVTTVAIKTTSARPSGTAVEDALFLRMKEQRAHLHDGYHLGKRRAQTRAMRGAPVDSFLYSEEFGQQSCEIKMNSRGPVPYSLDTSRHQFSQLLAEYGYILFANIRYPVARASRREDGYLNKVYLYIVKANKLTGNAATAP